MVARIVKYDNDGNVIYDGPSKRMTDQMSEQEKKSVLPFGLLPADIIKIVTMFCIGVAFIVKTDQRIAGLESTMSYLSTFTKNSDGWNSSVYGVQFEGGKPINANLNMTQLHRNQ